MVRAARPRVLHVIETLGRGGAEQALVNLLPALAGRVDVHACALREPYSHAETLERAGVPVHLLDLSFELDVVRGAAKLAALQRRYGYDVVHAHLFPAELAVALLPAPRGRPRKIVTFHNVGYDYWVADTAPKRLRRAAHGLILRATMSGATSVSRAGADSYERHTGLTPIDVIPIPFSVGARPAVRPAEAVRAAFGAPEGRFVFVLAGRTTDEKGHMVALQALASLRDHPRRPFLCLVGTGPLDAEIEATRRALGLLDDTSSFGTQTHEALVELFVSADAMLVASLREGFGLVALEAMGLGVPLVSTTGGSLAEVIDGGRVAFAATPGDPASLAAAMARAMDEPEERERRRRLALARVEEVYSTARIVDRWVETYAALVR
ncbi:MAG: glycosyltransferase family 4 protein [Polyangiaceae bacterium]|nr:glycosyltransferase family 4 protein [Polyangiaceae bacterium]